MPLVRQTCPGLPWGVPGPKTMGDPDFLPRGATNIRVCGFLKESRMEFTNAIKVYRKSGGEPYNRFC